MNRIPAVISCVQFTIMFLGKAWAHLHFYCLITLTKDLDTDMQKQCSTCHMIFGDEMIATK